MPVVEDNECVGVFKKQPCNLQPNFGLLIDDNNTEIAGHSQQTNNNLQNNAM